MEQQSSIFHRNSKLSTSVMMQLEKKARMKMAKPKKKVMLKMKIKVADDCASEKIYSHMYV